MVATRRLKDEPDELLMLGARLAAGRHAGERGAMLLFNPNHDSKGLFASGGAGGGGSSKGEGKASRGTKPSQEGPKASKGNARASRRETGRDLSLEQREHVISSMRENIEGKENRTPGSYMAGRLDIAHSELARYERGDFSEPKPSVGRKGETLEARYARQLDDVERHSIWETNGPGIYLHGERLAASADRESNLRHAFLKTRMTLNSRARAAFMTSQHGRDLLAGKALTFTSPHGTRFTVHYDQSERGGHNDYGIGLHFYTHGADGMERFGSSSFHSYLDVQHSINNWTHVATHGNIGAARRAYTSKQPRAVRSKQASDPATGMLLYNPNHDAKGKFSSGGGGGAAKGGKSGAVRSTRPAKVASASVTQHQAWQALERGEIAHFQNTTESGTHAGQHLLVSMESRPGGSVYLKQHMPEDILVGANHGEGRIVPRATAADVIGVHARAQTYRGSYKSAEEARTVLGKDAQFRQAARGNLEHARESALSRNAKANTRELDTQIKALKRLDSSASKAERAAQNAELVKQGYRDWSSGHAYLSNAGHYRVRETDASGRGTGKSHAAPWSKAVKAAHSDNSDFHHAATAYAKAHPNEIPAYYKTTAGVRQTSEPSKPMSRVTLRLPDALQRVQRFDETGPDGFHRSWIMLFPVGHYQHEQYGELDFTPAKLQKIKSQYDQRVRHIDAALDVDHRAAHDDSRATGWIESLELRDRQPDGTPAGLWGCIKWTPYGLKFLNADEYRYFSPEFGPWEDPQTGEQFEDVLIGGALTNRPFLKTMPAIALADGQADGGKGMAAVSKKPWGSVDKACLPASCFLIVGDPDKKSTWRLPVYEGVGPRDADGCYTKRGPLNLNGVKAAWAAVNGAHTGEPMSGVPASVVAKLKAWKAQYFPDDAKQASEASEGRGQGMEGRVSRKLGSLASVDTDLLDDEDENDEDAESLALADGGKPAKGSAAMKAKMAALRKKSSLKLGKKGAADSKDDAEDSEDDADEMAEDEEDNAEMADDTEGEEYDDSETYDDTEGDDTDEMLDDAEGEGEGADDDVDPEDDGGPEDEEDDEPPASARRGAAKMSAKSKKMMGARTAVSGGAHVRASEGHRRQGGDMKDGETISLAEAQQLREEVARLRFKLYEEGIEKTLSGWRKGSFQFRENAKDAPKTGRIALSKGFSESYRAFMRSVGVRLSESDRNKVGALLEIALSSAVVDLSERSSSYDPEGRMVGATKRRAAGDDEKLQQVAERIALAEHGKDIAALTDEPAKVLAIYERASREVRY